MHNLARLAIRACLAEHAQNAGFAEVNLELRVTVKTRKEPMPSELFIRTPGNPLIPAFGEALDSVLSPEEAAEFTEHLRPLVGSGTGRLRRALAYLAAIKE